MEIDLRGPEGNAFTLQAIATSAARQFSFNRQTTDAITKRMRSGTYEALLDVIDDEFPGVFRFIGDPRVAKRSEVANVVPVSEKVWQSQQCWSPQHFAKR